MGIPDEAPVAIDQPFGLVWLILALGAGLVLMLIGHSLGVVLNMLIARFAFGWPMAAIVEAGIGPPLSPFYSLMQRSRTVMIQMAYPEERLMSQCSGLCLAQEVETVIHSLNFSLGPRPDQEA